MGEGTVFLHRRVVWFISENYPLADLIHIQKPRITLRVLRFEMHGKLYEKDPNICTAFRMRISVFPAWEIFFLLSLCFELPVFDLFFYYTFPIHAWNAHLTWSLCSFKIRPPFPFRQNRTLKILFSISFQRAYWHNGPPLKKKCPSLFENAHIVGTPSASSSSSGKSPKEH